MPSFSRVPPREPALQSVRTLASDWRNGGRKTLDGRPPVRAGRCRGAGTRRHPHRGLGFSATRKIPKRRPSADVHVGRALLRRHAVLSGDAFTRVPESSRLGVHRCCCRQPCRDGSSGRQDQTTRLRAMGAEPFAQSSGAAGHRSPRRRHRRRRDASAGRCRLVREPWGAAAARARTASLRGSTADRHARRRLRAAALRGPCALSGRAVTRTGERGVAGAPEPDIRHSLLHAAAPGDPVVHDLLSRRRGAGAVCCRSPPRRCQGRMGPRLPCTVAASRFWASAGARIKWRGSPSFRTLRPRR